MQAGLSVLPVFAYGFADFSYHSSVLSSMFNP